MKSLLVIALVIATLVSGVLATFVVVGQSGANSNEVRITAQRLEDGRTEFGLQQREGVGWSERILPSGRYFPAEVEPGRWLNSTPIQLTGDAYRPLNLGVAAFVHDLENDVGIWFRNWERDDGSLGTQVYTRAKLDRYTVVPNPSYIVASCGPDGELWPFLAYVDGRNRGTYDNTETVSNMRAQVSFRFSGPHSNEEQDWLVVRNPDDAASFAGWVLLVQPSAHQRSRFITLLETESSVEFDVDIQLTDRYGSRSISSGSATFDVRNLFETYVQPNLDNCGEY